MCHTECFSGQSRLSIRRCTNVLITLRLRDRECVALFSMVGVCVIVESLMCAVGICESAAVIDLSRREGVASSLTESRILCPSHNDKDLYLYYFIRQYASGQYTSLCLSLCSSVCPSHSDKDLYLYYFTRQYASGQYTLLCLSVCLSVCHTVTKTSIHITYQQK